MPAGSYTTEALVKSVRRRAMLPAVDDTVSFPLDSDIIALANEEMVAFLVPWILKAREGHFIQSTDIALVSGQASYVIPSRATADDVSLVQLVDANGNTQGWPGLHQVELETALNMPSASWGLGNQFHFEANSIVLESVPTSSSGSLRLYYPQRPNQLVPANAVVATTSYQQSGGSFIATYAALPTGATFAVGAAFECIHAQPGFEVVPLGVASSITSNIATFPGTIPTTVKVGDQLALQDTANVMTYVPADLLPLFAQWLAMRLSEFTGKAGAVDRLGKGFAAMEKAALQFMKKRDALGNRKISAAASRPWLMRQPFYVR